ncbi:hypothetical protein RhiirA5_83894 [Rhizophagus irregularis]|uniref:Uncharacterized protein n=1 Tax=Rhizophagus irregularis TaxID=588596 RepID=A0A2N0NY22_9GLOM|nr:hypothetical protein RhiirA5_83894 [Rhizophagus irregularis]GET51779.1 hypothetical protein RIR_e20577_A0A2N0NY22_9GLOM [Rhizophagus irregularis DAOM 181602=DAOM 197198]
MIRKCKTTSLWLNLKMLNGSYKSMIHESIHLFLITIHYYFHYLFVPMNKLV